jgi:hypothetical protein
MAFFWGRSLVSHLPSCPLPRKSSIAGSARAASASQVNHVTFSGLHVPDYISAHSPHPRLHVVRDRQIRTVDRE